MPFNSKVGGVIFPMKMRQLGLLQKPKKRVRKEQFLFGLH